MHRSNTITRRKARRAGFRALALTAVTTVVASTWVAFGAAPTPAAADPFDPAVPMVWISQGDGNNGTLLQEAAQANGEVSFSPVGSAPTYNAIGYRAGNGYIYGVTPPQGPDPDARSHNIVRINNEGTVDGIVGQIPQAPDYVSTNGLIAGTFGEGPFADSFLVTRTANDRLYIINPDTGTFQDLALSGAPLQSPNGASDITAAYGFLWGVAQNGDYIVRIDPNTLTRVELPVPSWMFTDDGSFGGAWTYGNGHLAFSNNTSGLITQISVDNPGSASPTFNRISVVQGPPSGNNDGTSAPGDPADLMIQKSGPATVTVGDQISWTLTVTNNGPGGSSGYIVNDTVPASIQNVSSPNGECDVVGNAITCTGDQLPAGLSAQFTLTGTAPASPATIVNAASVIGYEADPVSSNNTDDATTTVAPVAQPSFSVTKSASTTTTGPESVVQYTVLVKNTGNVDYTTENPASFTDDLSGVLDDATYNGDASPGASVDGQILSWSGAVPVGQSVSVTYSVTVGAAGSGDGNLRNTVLPGAGGVCESCGTQTLLKSFSVSKQSSSADASPDDVVTYTVTVTNTGQVAYTADDPASFTDDLSGVLDDATYNGDASPGASVDGQTLSWSGAVPVGQSVSVTYSVTVGAAGSGDGNLNNAVLPGPGGDCATCQTTTGLQSFSVTKQASSTTASPDDVVTYTVTVTNTGQVAYTTDDPASFTDDLSGVLDDATYNGDASPGASVDGQILSWSGAVPVGQSVSVTYSVTVGAAGSGDGNLRNTVLPGAGGDCDTCQTTTGLQSFSVTKQASATVAQPGDAVGYLITVTNTGQVAYTADAPASFTDDLSGVLDDASYNEDATQGAAVDGSTLSWAGALGVGQTVTISYSVTVGTPSGGDGVLRNAVVTAEGDCVAGSTDPDCGSVTQVRAFSVLKSADTTVVDPGGVVTYTVTVANTGTVDIPDASFTDDMSGVLDDATYNGDASSGATVDGTTLSWTGPVAAGQTIVVTYSVTVNEAQTGDQILTNAVIPQGPGYCLDSDDCSTVTAGRSFSVTKSSSATVLDPGDVVTYTVTVRNTGEADYTADSPASFTDNLAGVLDDATYNEDATGGATVSGSALSWAGAIPIGGSVTVTYSFTVNDPRSGDRNLTNAVVPLGGGHCEGECSVTNQVRAYTVSKEASSAVIIPGQPVTYTVTVTNTGAAPYTAESPASFTDDMTDVLDDATYNDDATNGAVFAAPTLSWSGAVPVGESVSVTYSVTVNDPPTGDRDLTNHVLPGEGECGTACDTVTDVQSFSVQKQASASVVDPGDVLAYTIVVTNTGNVAYTADAPASFSDDLSAVLDDATYNGDATNGAELVGQALSWQGALAVGESITVTYTVTVNTPATGDRSIVNAVLPGTSGNCEDPSACSVETHERTFSVSKSGSATTVPLDGVLTYSIVVTNTGTADYLASDPASFTDDLGDVLDDATYNGDATSGAVVTGSTLAWAGPLAVGQSVTVTYSVTVDNPAMGDHLLRNAVLPDGEDGGECTAAAPCDVTTPVAAFHVSKQSDLEVVVPGQTITYTITVTNTGQVDYTEQTPASFSDDLSDVLDDAVYNDDATEGAVYTEPILSWSGPLPIGESTTITYSATVNLPSTGDDVLDNAVLTADGTGGECPVAGPAEDCGVISKVASYRVEKTSDAAQARPGDVVTYTVTVANTGQVDYTAEHPATFADDMSDVLDDAVFDADAAATRQTADAVEPVPAPDEPIVFEEPELTWAGPLAIGETMVVTYSVTLDAPATGDRIATNVLLADGGIGGGCADVESCAPQTLIASYEVLKEASEEQVTAGQTVEYAITVTNTGEVDYTDDAPAEFSDDLSEVLDKATYNDDASDGATVTDGMLTWSGPLAVGATAVITYSVTVDEGVSSGTLHNAVFAPSDSGSWCDIVSSVDGCSTDTEVVPPLASTGSALAAWTLPALLALLGLLVGAGLLTVATRRPVREV